MSDQPISPRRAGRRGARTALAALCLAAGAAAAQAPAPAPSTVYTNPVLARPQGVADPHILKYNGEYYLYATGDPIRAYHSTDLVNWTEIGPVLHGSRAPDAWNQADVWAPEVVYRNGRFYLYYTASRASPDWRVGEMARRVGVGVSDSPRGPFTDVGRPVTPGWAIDGHLFRDPDGGRDYFFFSYLYEPRLPGAGIVVDTMPSLLQTAGTPAHVTRGSEYWEDKDADPASGSLRYTNEAPTVLKRGGRYYMLYSGGSWDLPTYAMAYATSDRVMHPGGLEGPGWTKVTPPILRANPLVQGPGHNSVTKAPNNFDDVTAYHARLVPFRSPGDRQTFIDRLYWHRDRLFLQQPTPGALAAPDRPVFADLFNRAGGAPGAGWEVRGGWRISGNELVGSGVALPRTEPLEHYLWEANVRPGRSAAGVVAYYADAQNRVDVWLDPARRAVVSGGVLGGRRLPEQLSRLDDDFRFDAYHQILLTKNSGVLRVAVDGVNLQTRTLELGRGRPGLLTRSGSAAFDGVALTAAYEDLFDAPDFTWQTQGGAWMVEEGAYHQVAGGATRALALKGDAAEDYEFTASVRTRDTESTAALAGVVAAATDDGRLVVAGFDHTIWPFARFHVRYFEGGQLRQALAVGMPRGFRYDEYHTLRVVKQGDGFTFYLDGVETAAARFPVGVARPGLYTEGARAAFDDLAMKHLVVPQNLLLDGSFEAERWEAAPNAAPLPWQLAGAASVVECCAYAGGRRLLLSAPDGRATQTVTGLEPGRYTLWAWVVSAGAEPQIGVSPAGGAPRLSEAAGEAWRRVELDFELPAGQNSATVMLAARFAGAESYLAVDNVYLFRR